MAASDRTVALVTGYIRNVDRPDEEATKLGLPSRLAVVLSTGRKDKDYMYFDEELFLSLVEGIASAIPHDSLRMAMDPDNKVAFASLDELRRHYAGIAEEDREPFFRAWLVRNGQTACFIQTEFFVFVGGPQPYSDSYTLALYFREVGPERLSQACRDATERVGASVAAEIIGLPEPHVSFWTRVIAFLK